MVVAVALVPLACKRDAVIRPDPVQDEDHYVVSCLDAVVPNEEHSALWRDLATFAFALPEEEASPASDEIANRVLDRAAKQVGGLDTESAWQSAGRYFQAENFHSLERPACSRAWKMTAR